jgi:tRNA threonylcarbamoyladenosine biosynthesis protein TsaB
MKILALDTSTEACSAALLIDGDISERYRVAPREHGALILPMMTELLSDAGIKPVELDALAFGRGPGAFVGVRIATGVAQGIAFAAQLPVIPVSSLAALAQGADRSHVYSAIDARMNEVYWAAYVKNAQGIVELLGDEIVSPPENVPAAHQETGPSALWYGAGTGWGVYADVLSQQVNDLIGHDAQLFPRAGCVAQIAQHEFTRRQFVDPAEAVPTYLRNDVARKSANKKPL